MRFRLRVELELGTGSVADAEAAMARIEQAVHDAAGPSAVAGTASRADLTPADRAAAEAMAADGLGPGINSRRRSGGGRRSE